jgi:hypothetical protein
MDEDRPTPPIALEEIAEDMLDVLQRLGNLERGMQDAGAGIAGLRRALEETAIQQRKSLDTIRSEVVGDRRSLVLRLVFDPVAAAIDSLEMLGRGLDATREQAAYGQITAAAATLANVLLALGYQRFDTVAGEAFDPNRMQCFGYVAGDPGVVLEALHPGYSAANIVIRPARVLIADPAGTPLIQAKPAKEGTRHEA